MICITSVVGLVDVASNRIRMQKVGFMQKKTAFSPFKYQCDTLSICSSPEMFKRNEFSVFRCRIAARCIAVFFLFCTV